MPTFLPETQLEFHAHWLAHSQFDLGSPDLRLELKLSWQKLPVRLEVLDVTAENCRKFVCKLKNNNIQLIKTANPDHKQTQR